MIFAKNIVDMDTDTEAVTFAGNSQYCSPYIDRERERERERERKRETDRQTDVKDFT